MEPVEPTLRPCRQCGYHFSREEERCPRCDTDQVVNCRGRAGSIFKFLNIDPERIRAAFAKSSQD